MTLELIKNHDKLFAVVTNELGRKSKADLSPLLVLGADTDRLLLPLIAEIGLKSPLTMTDQLRQLHVLGEAFVHVGLTRLPETEWGWQQVVLDVHRFILTRCDSKASLSVRLASEWAGARKFFSILIEQGLMPISAYLPPSIKNLSKIDVSRYRADLLGQGSKEDLKVVDRSDNLLVSISLSRTDSEYLDEIRDTLAERRAVLFSVLTDYWRKLKQNLEFGRTLLATVDWTTLKNDLDSSCSVPRKRHPANPLNGRVGLANYLAVIKYQYDGVPPSDDTLRKNKDKTRYLPRGSSTGLIKEWVTKNDVPPNFLNQQIWSARNILWWWQGRISHLDVSMLTALLMMLQPSWTPHALLHATIANRNGKQYLDFPDNGLASFEVRKPRAGAMKEESLDPISLEIIQTLIKEGASLREKLAAVNDPLSPLLMIPYGRRATTAPLFSAASSFLSGSSKINPKTSLWIGTLYPELIQVGLTAGTISFAKIRKTEAVLEWFKTKSIKAVSKKLGNTERVVLDHYIPTPLLKAWNTRLIRRFQNLWITTAAANQTFLLDVTDFSTLEDLHSFLKDMLQLHQRGSSPLADALHQKFDFLISDISDVPHSAGHLHIAISTNTLAALYSYQIHLISLGVRSDLLDEQDNETGFTPRHFLSIADLLQSRLPLDKNPYHRRCHEEALIAAEAIAARTKWPSIRGIVK